MSNNLTNIVLSAFLGLLMSSFTQKTEVVVYPIPDGEPVSKAFSLKVEERDVPVYIAKVAPLDKKLRYKAMDDKVNSAKFYDEASFAYFDIAGKAKVRVKAATTVSSVKILPSSAKVDAVVKGDEIEFPIRPGQHLTVEINGDIIHSLHVFANPVEKNAPDAKDPNVIYFGPGIHTVSRLIVRDNQTLYLAGGAILRTIVSEQESEGADPVTGLKKQPYHPSISLIGKNIKVKGRGIIDASLCPTHARNMLMVEGKNISIEGVILRDASVWTVPVRMSDNVHIDNIKLIGYRANSDGIDICNSTNVLVENCFIRTLDDLIVVKTLRGKGECRNITIRKNVLWNEVAHALSIGAEINDNISDVFFSDCDIIHDQGREWALRIYHCDAAKVKNVRFDDIRIEECRKLISLWINKDVWTSDAQRGHIDNVFFKNIVATGEPAKIELLGYGASNLINQVVFKNIRINGLPLTNEQVEKNEFVNNVIIK